MPSNTKKLLVGFKNRIVTNKKVLPLAIIWVIYLFLEATHYIINKFNVDKRYFEETYRKRHLDQYALWDDNLLSPREMAVTEAKPPTLILI